jgi:prophage maintenance system killer protein
VLRSYQDIDLTVERIQQLHKILLRLNDGGQAGQQESKTGELKELLRWTSTAFDGGMHPILAAAIFKVLFPAIHPFQEGNGRLSRILTNFLLLRAGYDYVAHSSLEAVIEKDKDYYHKALQRTQATLDGDSPNWQPWFAFFLRYLKIQKAKLAPAMEQIEGEGTRRGGAHSGQGERAV